MDLINSSKAKKGNPELGGATPLPDGVNFTMSVPDEAEASLVITDASGKKILQKIPLPVDERTGDLNAVLVPDFDAASCGYYYLVEGKKVLDPYARMLVDGICRIPAGSFDWENDRHPETALHRSLIYKLHVRGFTKDSASRVRKKGTFAGVEEKLSYIKELGFTAVEFMPMYEWDDTLKVTPHTPSANSKETVPKNFWGYADVNFYFAPKQSFSSQEDSYTEVCSLIHAMHGRGLECILEFYVPDGTSPLFVRDAVHYWVSTYHVDGFHFVGNAAPVDLLAKDPFLTGTKLFFERVSAERVYGNRTPIRRNILEYNDDFMMNGRALLKGDEGQLMTFMNNSRRNPPAYAFVNYMANVNGFTLMDMVSYDWKHNEKNGEDNQDGPALNFSWNCGTEGPTRKKAILDLRKKQIRNAMCYVMLSQGVPLLYAGDEFGNSQNGNNNAYSSDDETGWVDWKNAKRNEDLTSFLKELIAFRMLHPILHMRKQLRETDYLSLGYPDVSCHDTKAWYCPFDSVSRSIGLMYCGLYAKKLGENKDFIYIAYNAHWEEHGFALPSLPKGEKWYPAVLTDAENGKEFPANGKPLKDQRKFDAAPRSVSILVGQPDGPEKA